MQTKILQLFKVAHVNFAISFVTLNFLNRVIFITCFINTQLYSSNDSRENGKRLTIKKTKKSKNRK